jgi:tetratricopeptide (TPR) repeat protein
VVSVQGQVEIQRAGQSGWKPVQLEEILCPGDSVRVIERSRVAIALANETLLRLDQHSAVAFPIPEKAATSWLDVLKGAIYLISRVPRPSQVNTPFVTAALRGTEFLIRVDRDETLISVYEGEVIARNRAGSLSLTSGQTGVAKADAAPVRRVVVKPRDAVQWALYYPPVIDARARLYQTGPVAPTLQAALARYRQNDLAGAFATLDTIPAKLRDERYYTLQAQLLLLVGRVEQARSAIKEALNHKPGNATALALQAIVFVVQNDKARALRLAEQAVEREPQSAVTQIALSYVQQANFDIDKALASVQEAVRLNPENALAWARLAELQLSRGDLKHALKAAQEAVARDPNLARTQAVLGFAYLTRIEVAQARAAFNEAIRLDQADPLSRLGLGLAKIRQGDLSEGRQEIEIAAGLDPTNSLIRSYLGKAYFEEKRDKLSADQLTMAKELDPKDPTPWFYDAIRKQTENRPVEALRDLEKSIELNDNRAVYRSRLLLDQDRAARETSLAKIYDDLGFDQVAQVEATKSLSLDPANYSAHRFLSDSYANRPRHEIARVSELLQAQLLQPININPVQPSLNEARLNIATGIGPTRATFNEFTPLFERNRAQLTASGIFGNNKTYGDEAVLAGVFNQFSYSLGQFYYETDGFRKGSNVKHDIYNAFAQAAVTDKVNVQLEYRHRETEQGDIRLRLDPEFAPPGERRTLEHDIGRVGLHFAPFPQGDVVVSFIHSDRREALHQTSDCIPPTPGVTCKTDVNDDRRGYEAETQYLLRGDRFNLTLGGGAYRVDAEKLTTSAALLEQDLCNLYRDFAPNCTVPGDSGRDLFDDNGNSVYAYTNVRFLNLVSTFGFSYESYHRTGSQFDLHKVNPKLGLQWDITDWIRLRAAYLQTLKRPLVVDQTIEPTQVVGFNQFFDDYNGTQVDLYGVGIDTILADNLYGGFEYTRRDLAVPVLSSGAVDEWDEDSYHAYLYWTPHRQWSFSAEYRLERDRVPLFQLDTNIAPVAIRYFSPLGFFGQMGTTFVWQDKDIKNGQSLNDDFAVVDVAVGYRLPRRWGILSLEVGNLFDEKFRFEDTSFKTSDQLNVIRPFLPDRTILTRMVLNF